MPSSTFQWGGHISHQMAIVWSYSYIAPHPTYMICWGAISSCLGSRKDCPATATSQEQMRRHHQQQAEEKHQQQQQLQHQHQQQEAQQRQQAEQNQGRGSRLLPQQASYAAALRDLAQAQGNPKVILSQHNIFCHCSNVMFCMFAYDDRQLWYCMIIILAGHPHLLSLPSTSCHQPCWHTKGTFGTVLIWDQDIVWCWQLLLTGLWRGNCSEYVLIARPCSSPTWFHRTRSSDPSNAEVAHPALHPPTLPPPLPLRLLRPPLPSCPPAPYLPASGGPSSPPTTSFWQQPTNGAGKRGRPSL